MPSKNYRRISLGNRGITLALADSELKTILKIQEALNTELSQFHFGYSELSYIHIMDKQNGLSKSKKTEVRKLTEDMDIDHYYRDKRDYIVSLSNINYSVEVRMTLKEWEGEMIQSIGLELAGSALNENETFLDICEDIGDDI